MGPVTGHDRALEYKVAFAFNWQCMACRNSNTKHLLMWCADGLRAGHSKTRRLVQDSFPKAGSGGGQCTRLPALALRNAGIDIADLPDSEASSAVVANLGLVAVRPSQPQTVSSSVSFCSRCAGI